MGTRIVISLKAGYEEALGRIIGGEAVMPTSYWELVKEQEMLSEAEPRLAAFALLAASPDARDRDAALGLVESELSALQQEILREAECCGGPCGLGMIRHASDISSEDCPGDGLHWRWQGEEEDPSHDRIKVPRGAVLKILGRLEKLP